MLNPSNITGSVIKDIAQFDRHSGSVAERMIFNNRPIIIAICAILTIFLGFENFHLNVNADFERTIPTKTPMMLNYLSHYQELRSEGNALHIVVEADKGTIIDPVYLKNLQALNDDVFLTPGVDRGYMTSLWTPSTVWTDVTEDGIDGGPVIGESYDGSPAALSTVFRNIQKTGRIGELVGTDFRSSMIYVPLLDRNNITGRPLDYGLLARQLNALRAKYAADGMTLHITGFAMVVGDMINGVRKILAFFTFSILMTSCVLYWYTRCIRSTLLVVACSMIAVIWQLGLLPILGYDLDPYSVLVPFLIFAIGMSHGAQKMNGVMQDIGRGTHRLIAARYTFRRLFVAGFTALSCDAIGFAVLGLIQIEAIRNLALIASTGVVILIFTNLILLPVLLSYTGVSSKAAIRSLRSEMAEETGVGTHPIWRILGRFTQKKWALPTIVIAVLLGVGGYMVGRHSQVGDLGTGAPELRTDSQYNQDNDYIISHYTTTSDTMVVMVDSRPSACTNFKLLSVMSDLEWQLQQMPEVQSTNSLAGFVTLMSQAMTEDAPKWYGLVDNQKLIDDFTPQLPATLKNLDCSFAPLQISLVNHKAATLSAVVNAVNKFIGDPKNQSADFKFSLAGGNAGVQAATNFVVAHANEHMLYWVYGAVSILCFIAFRSIAAVICAIIPLILTSILCQALMVWMNIGITVATLPVTALGVGIGVDYALYVLGIVLALQRRGATLNDAYSGALLFTGKVVFLTGFTLAASVAMWAFAPIKFQADMGILLSFMFLWNMVGALVLAPALASFLLNKPIGILNGNVASDDKQKCSRIVQ
jgi:predicted RND superfamily exporter protein